MKWPVLLSVACALTAASCLVPTEAAARKKTDLVFLNNGDRITGEIKYLDRGILQLKTDDIGTINIEWEDVDSLNSVYQFRVEDGDGDKYFGAIFIARDGTLEVIHEGQVETTRQDGVVAITPLEASFWQQIDGSVSLGLSYTKSNSLGQLTFDLTARRRTSIRVLSVDVSSITTWQEGKDDTRRQDVTLSFNRLFQGRLYAATSASAQTNDELGLDLRVLFSPGLGVNLVQTNHNELVTVAGLSVNREWSSTSEDGYNLEAFASVGHSVFRYDYPKTDITSTATVYPGLTSWGRVRAEIDIGASREVVKDFTVFLSFYDSYDSDPLDPAAGKNDYGVVLSVGWTF